jgi:serine/threonine protein kinase
LEKSGGARQRSAFSADPVERTSDLVRLRGTSSQPETPTSPTSISATSSSLPSRRDPDRTDPIGDAADEKGKSGNHPGFADEQARISNGWFISTLTLVAGRYEVLEQVRHSGMGLVYKARDRHRERAGLQEPFVALKVACPAGDDSMDTTGYLRQEFLKLSRLRHPNIVAVYDLETHAGNDFMVLEWLQGETLAELLGRINSKRIALSKAQEIITSVAEALAHAHKAAIVHGDIKPSNIFLTEQHVVKILDFGSSGRTSDDTGEAERSWATLGYASCELLSGEAPRPCDDVFALGITAYGLLCGERPYGDLDARAAREQGLAPAPLPEDAQEHWPAIRAALQLDPAERPADAGEFLSRFTDRIVEPSPAPFPRPVPMQRMAIVYGALAALVLAATVWWSIPEVPRPSSPVRTLLEDAEEAFAENRLIEPADDSAYRYYRSILEEDPDNAVALGGIDRIAEHYLSGARTALAAENYNGAMQNFETARQVQPTHFGIAAIEDLLVRYRRDLLVRARQAASNDLDQAQVYLTRAALLSDANDPEVAAVRAELQREARIAEVDSLLRGIDERILAERLTVPAGDSALDLLRRARQLGPDDRQVRLAADRIVTALLFQAMFAISHGDLEDAGMYIDAAKSLQIRHLALARAEYELARATHQEMIRQPSLAE